MLRPGPVPAAALGALIQAISGAPFPPRPAAVAALAADPRPATLAGVRLLAAGRLGPGLLLVREEAAIAPPVPAEQARGTARRGTAASAWLATRPRRRRCRSGALGDEAARLRRRSALPSAVLRTLARLAPGGTLFAVPASRLS